jgi:hypothetical protein
MIYVINIHILLHLNYTKKLSLTFGGRGIFFTQLSQQESARFGGVRFMAPIFLSQLSQQESLSFGGGAKVLRKAFIGKIYIVRYLHSL